MNKKYLAAVAGTVLAGTLSVGAVANAEGTGTTVPTATKCERVDEIEARLNTAQERIAGLKTKLEARRATAEAAGHTAVVEKIDRALNRVDRIAKRLDAREKAVQTWAANNC